MDRRTYTTGDYDAFYPNVTLSDPPVPCPCCGEKDTQVPCCDCQAWCDETDHCKAHGFTKMRLRFSEAFYWLARFVEPRKG
ncbi:hypothetical protein LCGC14_1228130 [marine sediment metagenome]|uniref:Uncharacterized protein n=1 Tax=marine sediment metagenome TaxID=412755 RepID=A0A0F9L992_9ZZZZ